MNVNHQLHSVALDQEHELQNVSLYELRVDQECENVSLHKLWAIAVPSVNQELEMHRLRHETVEMTLTTLRVLQLEALP